MENKLINGDCTLVMPTLPAESVNLVVTSPPYQVNKSYEEGVSNEEFKNLLHGVFTNVYRLLAPGGYFCVNFGDAFNSGNRFYDSEIPSVFPMTVWYYEWGKAAGFDLQATRIWRKQFAKMSIPFVCNSYPRNIFDYEHVWTFRKRDGIGKETVYDRKQSQRGVLGDGWSSAAKIDQHCAAFPVELPMWAISVYSKEGDTVLDPFLGSGTTGKAALAMGRNFIGIERDKTYFEMAKRNVELSDSVIQF